MYPLSPNTLYNTFQQHHKTKSNSTPLYVAQRRKQIVTEYHKITVSTFS